MAIALEKGVEFVAVQMAVIKCGAAFVPLSKSMGEDCVQFVLNDCKPDLVFDNDHLELAKNFEPLPISEWADSDEHDLATTLTLDYEASLYKKESIERFGKLMGVFAKEIMENRTLANKLVTEFISSVTA